MADDGGDNTHAHTHISGFITTFIYKGWKKFSKRLFVLFLWSEIASSVLHNALIYATLKANSCERQIRYDRLNECL